MYWYNVRKVSLHYYVGNIYVWYTVHMTNVQEEDDWFVVEDDQAMLKVVGGTIRDGSVFMATFLAEVVGGFPKMAINVSSDGAGAVHHTCWCQCHHGYQPTEQDFIHRGGADSSHQPLLR